VVEQEVTTQGIIMSKGVELVFITSQEIIVLLKVQPTLVKGVHVVVRV
jgi:hypothetical protein